MTETPHTREPEPKPHDPGSSGFWWIPGGLLIAAAAAILAWSVWPPNEQVRSLGGGEPPTIASAEPLPAYVLETDGGLEAGTDAGVTTSSDHRDASARHRYQRDTKFEWILRPKGASEGEVGVRGFAFVNGSSAGLPLRLDDLVQVAETGAIRITGRAGQLDLEPGRYTIALAVGRPTDLPTQAAEVHAPAAAPATLAWQVRRVDIEIGD